MCEKDKSTDGKRSPLFSFVVLWLFVVVSIFLIDGFIRNILGHTPSPVVSSLIGVLSYVTARIFVQLTERNNSNPFVLMAFLFVMTIIIS